MTRPSGPRHWRIDICCTISTCPRQIFHLGRDVPVRHSDIDRDWNNDLGQAYHIANDGHNLAVDPAAFLVFDDGHVYGDIRASRERGKGTIAPTEQVRGEIGRCQG